MTGKDTDVREVFIMKDDHTQIMEMYAPNPRSNGEWKSQITQWMEQAQTQ